jgi:hypothetical protein
MIMNKQSPTVDNWFTITAAELLCPDDYSVDGENSLRHPDGIKFDVSRHGEVVQPVLFFGPYISVDPGVYLFTLKGKLEGDLQIDFTHEYGSPIKHLIVDSFHPIVLVLTRRLNKFEVVGRRTSELKFVTLESIMVHHINPGAAATSEASFC